MNKIIKIVCAVLIATSAHGQRPISGGIIQGGTIPLGALSTQADQTFLCNRSGGVATPTACTATQSTAVLNAMVGDSGSGGTKGLAPAPGAGDAAAGKFLKASGAWAVPAGTGVTSIATTSPITGGTITTSGTIACATCTTSAASLTAHAPVIGAGSQGEATVAAMTDGQILVGATSADPVPRTVSGDATFSSAGALTVTKTNGSSFAAVATSGSASDLGTGTLPAGRLPNPSASSLGGVESYAAVTHQWINSISTSGVPGSTQPACADLSDSGSGCTATTGIDGTATWISVASTQTLGNNWHTIGTNTTTISSATVTMTAAPSNRQMACFVVPGAAITTLTVAANSGQTLSGGQPTTLAAAVPFCEIYRTATTEWYRIE